MYIFHVFISGFSQTSQTSGQRSNGVLRRFREAVELTKDDPSVRCEIRNYNADMDELAGFIQIMAGETTPAVNVYAYSWGGGRGFISLARAMQARGLYINNAYLCDAVYSSWFSLAAPVMAFAPWAKIKVPGNVMEVKWMFQRMNKPQGHYVVAANPDATKIHPGDQLMREHAWMDESDTFRSWVIEGVEKYMHAPEQ